MDAGIVNPSSIIVTWATPRESDEEWVAFIKRWRVEEPDAELEVDGAQADTPLSLGPVLIPNDRIAVVSKIRQQTTRWVLHLQPRPSTPPPPPVQELTHRIGGEKGLLALLLADPPVSANYRIKAELPENHWRCLAIPRVPVQDDPSLQLDPDATVEQIGYRMTGPNGLLEVSIIYRHVPREFALSLFAKGILAPREDLSFAYAEDILNIGIRTFFQRESNAIPT